MRRTASKVVGARENLLLAASASTNSYAVTIDSYPPGSAAAKLTPTFELDLPVSDSNSTKEASAWSVGACIPALQRILFFVGLAFAIVYISARIDSWGSARLAVWAFAAAQETSHRQAAILTATSQDGDVDVSLWSARRIDAYKSSLALKLDRPLAVLTIPRLHLAAPVFEGTDSLTLNRGLGRITGTAMLGGDGNVGIAGHRDGFFRALRGIALGDAVEIATANGRDLYTVDRIKVVDPGDISVLNQGAGTEVTLVTCYPFYFIGDAPRRYIVQASLKQRSLQLPVRLATSPHLETPKEK